MPDTKLDRLAVFLDFRENHFLDFLGLNLQSRRKSLQINEVSWAVVDENFSSYSKDKRALIPH